MIHHRLILLTVVASCSVTTCLLGQAVEAQSGSISRSAKNLLHFHESAKVVAHVIRLGDLAVVSLADAQRQEYLSSLVLYSSPAPGGTRQIRARQVHEELLLRNIDLDGIELRGASRIAVTRVAQPQAATPMTSNAGLTPAGTIPAVTPGKMAANPNTVVVLKRPLRRGQRVNLQDLAVVPIRGVKLRNIDPVRDVDNLIGRELVRSLREGDAIDRSWIVEPTLVRRGAIVSVIVRVGGVLIRTTAKSQQNGTMNDIIIMESLTDRNKSLTGRVVGIDQVEILAQGSTYEPIRQGASVAEPRRRLIAPEIGNPENASPENASATSGQETGTTGSASSS